MGVLAGYPNSQIILTECYFAWVRFELPWRICFRSHTVILKVYSSQSKSDISVCWQLDSLEKKSWTVAEGQVWAGSCLHPHTISCHRGFGIGKRNGLRMRHSALMLIKKKKKLLLGTFCTENRNHNSRMMCNVTFFIYWAQKTCTSEIVWGKQRSCVRAEWWV